VSGGRGGKARASRGGPGKGRAGKGGSGKGRAGGGQGTGGQGTGGQGEGKGSGGGHRSKSVRVQTARRRTISSTRWLERQLNDPYVAEARRRGLRSRAAFKLLEIDDKLHLLRPGQVLVDLGAAPGGWTQVAVERVGSLAGRGKVIALDLQPIDPIAGAIILEGDFLDPDVEAAVRRAAGGGVDGVLSDMSPSAVGHAATDHLRIVALVEVAADFAEQVLAPGGFFVAKVFQGGAETDLLARLKRSFAKVRHVKPPSSRKESAETYLVATGFRRPEPAPEAAPEAAPDAG